MTGDTERLHPEFRAELEAMEHELGLKFHVTSGYRDQGHNQAVGGVSKSAHTETPCKAADIACTLSGNRYAIVKNALQRGFKRIGIGKEFVHLDRSTNLPQDVIWHYYPKENKK